MKHTESFETTIAELTDDAPGLWYGVGCTATAIARPADRQA